MAGWLDLALAAWQTYQNNKGPKFSNPGLTPEQSQLYNLYFGSLTNPELKDNAAWANQATKAQVSQHMASPGWTSAKTYGGNPGYQGMGALTNQKSPWAPTITQTPTEGGGGESPKTPEIPNVGPSNADGGGGFGGYSGAGGSTGFGGFPTSSGQAPTGQTPAPTWGSGNNTSNTTYNGGVGSTPSNWESIQQWLRSNPTAMKTVGTIAAAMGIPLVTAAAWAFQRYVVGDGNNPLKNQTFYGGDLTPGAGDPSAGGGGVGFEAPNYNGGSGANGFGGWFSNGASYSVDDLNRMFQQQRDQNPQGDMGGY